jgi:hypothetical protein
VRTACAQPVRERARQSQRIGAVPLLRQQHQVREPRRQRSVERGDVVTGEHLDAHAMRAPDLAPGCVGREGRGAFVRERVALLDDQLGHAGARGQRAPFVERHRQQGVQRVGDPVHARLSRRALELPQPGRYGEAVAQWNEQRAGGIEQPSRHVLPGARKPERYARAATEAACVAERAVFAWGKRVDQRHVVALHLQVARTRESDHPRTDDDDALSHQR